MAKVQYVSSSSFQVSLKLVPKRFKEKCQAVFPMVAFQTVLNVDMAEHGLFLTSEDGTSSTFFFDSSFLQAVSAVMPWCVHVQEVLHSGECRSRKKSLRKGAQQLQQTRDHIQMGLLEQRLFLPHRSLQPQVTLQQSNRQDNQDVLPWSNLIDGGHISRVPDQNGVSLLYISCLRYTILVRNPRYIIGLFLTSERGASSTFFLNSSFLQAVSAVMPWCVHVQEVLQAS